METIDISKRCYTCAHWTGNRKDESGQGECHRNPPQVAGLVQQRNMAGQEQPVAVSTFPTSSAINWCSKHEMEVVLQ